MSKRMLASLAAAVCALGATGCTIDIQPTLPPVVTEFQYPLPPLVPIVSDLFLPKIDLCATASEEAIDESLSTVPFGGLLADWIEIERIELVQAVMEGTAPPDSTFEGFTEVSILQSGTVLLTATEGDGIEGNRIELTPQQQVNLWEAIQRCPDEPAELTVRARGLMPLKAPTRWEMRVTVRLVASVNPF
ncbi:MAG: hypothetical protein GC168_17210 [Candidatus Hydrogenedens sp.]|nr:hypothetical protein [Candidatus Hydrogenedens sp.]